MAIDLGSTFKELIDEINSKGSGTIDSINGLKGGTLSSPLTFTGGDGTNAKKAILDNTNNGQITDKSTGTLLGFIGSDFVVGSNSYLTKIRGNANSTIGGKKISDLAVKSDIPDTSDYVKLTTDQTISGIKTFNAPTNVSGSETITTKFKTSNGGALIIGKEGANSGTMLRFDQVDGKCRLRFRSSATAGSMVWEQPEKNASLYFDMGNSAGSGVNRVTLRNIAGTLALTKEIPAAVSANPTLSGSETELTSIKIGDTTYKAADVTLAGDNTFTGNNSFTNGVKIVLSSNTAMTYKCGSIEYLSNGESFTLTLPVKDGIVATRDEIHNHSKQIISNFGIKGTAYNLSQSNIADLTTAALVLGGTVVGSTTTTYKVGAIANKGVTLTLPTAAGTLATQEYVDNAIGNIDTLLTSLNSGTGV